MRSGTRVAPAPALEAVFMRKPTDLLRDVQLRLAALSCPSCAKGRLDLRLRCDISAAECLYLATCDHCAAEYWVDCDSLPEHAGDATFSCDAVTHRCTYVSSG
jgi:hypothetical protein